MHIYLDFNQEILCFRSLLMGSVNNCFVLKKANVYPVAVWAFLAVSAELLENEIFFSIYFLLFERKIDMSNRLTSFVVIKPQRKICL